MINGWPALSTDVPNGYGRSPNVGRVPRDMRRSLGALGERLAEDHLRRAGYRVLERNYRTRFGELDLIAAGGGCIVFCEVRTRLAPREGALAFGGPLDSIGQRKRRQVRRMAREWLATRAGTPAHADGYRFDAIGVVLERSGALLTLDHVEAAF